MVSPVQRYSRRKQSSWSSAIGFFFRPAILHSLLHFTGQLATRTSTPGWGTMLLAWEMINSMKENEGEEQHFLLQALWFTISIKRVEFLHSKHSFLKWKTIWKCGTGLRCVILAAAQVKKKKVLREESNSSYYNGDFVFFVLSGNMKIFLLGKWGSSEWRLGGISLCFVWCWCQICLICFLLRDTEITFSSLCCGRR